ncbi:MAG: hypothetical protein KKE17_05565 [Proteobacteria bacterium]|nr:hypothetical protein [Pseudomonadota bacterium]MBU1709459.1 hypothetical protein [Pseudomonadota bacterium]
MQATGYKKRAALERCLRNLKISFHIGNKGQIWTTMDAVNQSLGLQDPTQNSELEFM